MDTRPVFQCDHQISRGQEAKFLLYPITINHTDSKYRGKIYEGEKGKRRGAGRGKGGYGEGRSIGRRRGGSGKVEKNDAPWRPRMGSSRKMERSAAKRRRERGWRDVLEVVDEANSFGLEFIEETESGF